MSQTDLFFSNEQGSATSGSNFVQDAFQDISLPATNNTALTSSASTNPLGDFFANDDVPRFSVKTLWFQDFVLIADRSKWISNKPTYRIVFNESTTPVHGYCFGDIDFNTGRARRIGDGFGVTGVVRKVQWIVRPAIGGTATGQLALDGAATTTINIAGDQATGADALGYFVAEASNETNDLHDYRLTALQNDNLQVVGVVVYSENSGANLQFNAGTTYNNKNKQVSTAGATLSVPAYGSSLGGRTLLYHNASNIYAQSALAATMVQSVAVGSSGTNLVNVTTGHGARFNVGDGIVINSPLPQYVGSVSSVSTDTLTVNPTLTFGVSQLIYRAWSAGPTYAMSSTLMQMIDTLDFSQLAFTGSTEVMNLLQPMGRWNLWGRNVQPQVVDSVQALSFTGASYGFLQLDGMFSAADIEFIGAGILHATFTVNGMPAFGINEGSTGAIRKTILTNSGPGWNSFNISVGTSFGTSLAISKINLYRNSYDQSVTAGLLADFSSHQTPIFTSAANASLSVVGSYRRVYADQLFLNSDGSTHLNWQRQATYSAPGGVQFFGATTQNSPQFTFEWYGKNFSYLGLVGSSYLATLDGVSVGITPNALTSVSSEGFHKLVYIHKAGTSIIQAIDYTRTYGELMNLQKTSAFPVTEKTGTLEFDIQGQYSIAGQSQTGVLFEFIPKDIKITGHKLMAKLAGSTGILQLDVQYKNKSTGFTSLFRSGPSVNALAGDGALSQNGQFVSQPFVLQKDSILRLDMTSAQVGGSGYLLYLYYKEL